jgi:hypothetical protein
MLPTCSATAAERRGISTMNRTAVCPNLDPNLGVASHVLSKRADARTSAHEAVVHL